VVVPKVLPEDLSQLIKVVFMALIKHWVLHVPINGSLERLDEVEVHLELIYRLELDPESSESALKFVLIQTYLILLDGELAKAAYGVARTPIKG